MKLIIEKHLYQIAGCPKLEYAVAGEGRPIIVFLSGYGTEMITSWRKVYPEAGQVSSVFAYNRPGYGGSDKADKQQTGAAIVSSLRDFLLKIGLNPPYVLVGHSIGGLYANLFARLHPQEISGVVLVDSAHPEQQKLLRVHEGMVQRIVTWILNVLDSAIHSRHSEISSFNETAMQIRDAGPFPAIPLIVISAGKQPASWLVRDEVIRVLLDNQRSLASMSPNGKQVIAEKSGHFVQNDEPELVIQAIREIVDKNRVK